MSTTKKLTGAFAGLFAIVIALALAPSAAFADTFTGGTLTVTGVEAGDTVYLYQVVVDDYDSTTNEMTRAFADDGLSSVISWDDYVGSTYTDEVKANIVATYLRSSGTVYTSATATDTSVTFTSLEAGQYLVVVVSGEGNTTRAFQNTLVTVEPVANSSNNGYEWSSTATTVAVKYTDMSDPIDKTVDGSDNASVAAGDTVKFTITATIPSYAANATDRVFKITDTAVNSTIDSISSVTIVADGETLATLTAGTDYTIKYTYDTDGTTITGFVLTLTNDTIVTYSGQSVVITYDGTISSSASSTTATYNSADLEFSVDSSSTTTDEPDNPDTAYTYSYRIEFYKTNSSGEALTGAVFTLTSTTDSSVSYTSTYDSTTGTYYFDGIAAGTYTLSETTVPSGYVAIDDMTVTIDSTEVNDDYTTDTIYLDSDTSDSYDNTLIDEESTFLDSLPTTGEAGTAIITIVGIGLMAFAISRIARSRSKEE